MSLPIRNEPFGGWSVDATMTLQALWLLLGFGGFNLVAVGLVTVGVLALTRHRPIMPRQGQYVALVGEGIASTCVEGPLFLPDLGLGIVALCAGAFVGLLMIVVGPVMSSRPTAWL